jgi:hypothetical protein
VIGEIAKVGVVEQSQSGAGRHARRSEARPRHEHATARTRKQPATKLARHRIGAALLAAFRVPRESRLIGAV